MCKRFLRRTNHRRDIASDSGICNNWFLIKLFGAEGVKINVAIHGGRLEKRMASTTHVTLLNDDEV